MSAPCPACGCPADAPRTHRVAAALAAGDVDAALEAGLLEVERCPGCTPACAARVAAMYEERRRALEARERYRARNARLARRAEERAARRAAPAPDAGAAPPGAIPGTHTGLPEAAAAALARAKARAAGRTRP